VGIGAHSHMDADVAARRTSGPSAVPSAAQPCFAKRDGPPAVREPRKMQTRRDSFGRALIMRTGRAGWIGRTCDVRCVNTSPGRQGGAGQPTSRNSTVAGPDVLGGKSRKAYIARGTRAGIRARGATLGRSPSPRHRNSARISWMVLWKQSRECQDLERDTATVIGSCRQSSQT
jgi:hypothetical protein